MTHSSYSTELIHDVTTSISRVVKKHNLSRGQAEVTLLEFMAQTLHELAPTETEEFLDELSMGDNLHVPTLLTLRQLLLEKAGGHQTQ